MVEHKIKKLPLVDHRGVLTGLITAKDLLKHKQQPFATRDGQGRLRVGAAIGAKGDYLERAAELIRAGVDVIVIDIAYGYSVVMASAIEAFRKRFGDHELIAGNVGTGEGARFLAERGVRRDGALVQALVFGGDTAMLGSAFAGTAETPGDVVQKPVLLQESQRPVQVPFKVLRGMASISAIKDRLDVEDREDVDVEALGAEGLEVSVPARGSVRPLIHEMVRHVCSAISYGGARTLS